MPGFWKRVGVMFQFIFSSPWEFFRRIPATGFILIVVAGTLRTG